MPERASRVLRLLGPRGSSVAAPSQDAVLARLGLPACEVAPAVAHVPAVRAGTLVFTSGQLPFRDGELLATGKLGDALGVADGQACAQWCALNALAAIRSEIGDLGQVERVVKVVVYVASGALFVGRPGSPTAPRSFSAACSAMRGDMRAPWSASRPCLWMRRSSSSSLLRSTLARVMHHI